MSELIYEQIGNIAMNAKGPITINQLSENLELIIPEEISTII